MYFLLYLEKKPHLYYMTLRKQRFVFLNYFAIIYSSNF